MTIFRSNKKGSPLGIEAEWRRKSIIVRHNHFHLSAA